MNTPEAPDPRKVAEAALDVFVYAPVGLALEAKELLPKLAERGRNHVVLARLGARFAMQKAESEAEKLLGKLQGTADDGHPTGAPAGASPASPSPDPADVAVPEPPPRAKRTAKPLAIPAYDTLSASQVVPRLDALRRSELDAIKRHELAHRGRRTILSRIAQLQR